MPKTEPLQTNFSAGELDPDLIMRQDTEQYQNGAKSLHNRRCLVGGGTVRRPGTWLLKFLPSRSRIVRWTVNRTTQYVIAFGDGSFNAYARDPVTGLVTFAASLGGCPWTGNIFREMAIVQSANTMFITHDTMPPQIITRTGATSFARAPFAFKSGAAGRIEQPYLKLAPAAMTLTCSDVTGSITLTVSGATPFFVSAHIGQYIRYHKKACLITAVDGGGLSCTATVIERLPETYVLTVSSSANFAVGEVVSGSVTGAKAIIIAIPGASSITVILLETLIAFTTSDKLIGPNDSTTISAVGTTTNGAVTDWDEQLIGPVYGYPSCVGLHRNRLLFGGMPSAADYLAASALGDLFNFNVGDGSDADAILESIGDNAASRIVQIHSAEQLIVSTDNGLYYVPENAQQPFRPSSMAFFPFGSNWPISPNVEQESFDNGVVLVSGSLVIAARPTGDATRAWKADEVSLLSGHLFKSPTAMTVVSRFSGGLERYALFRNADGTLAVLQLIDAEKVRNTTPWETDRATDTFDSLVAIEEDLYVACIRQIGGNTVFTLELFDQNVTLDCATRFNSLSDVQATYGSTVVNIVTTSGLHLGTNPPALDTIPAGPYIVGLFYGSEIETLPPVIEGDDGSKVGNLMRIVEADIYVADSARFAANGYVLSAYQLHEDPTGVPPKKSGPQHFGFLGWKRQPTITIMQPDPLPLKLLAIHSRVAY